MWADELIAGPMGYKYCVLFPRARDAMAAYERSITIPSNVCPVIRKFAGIIVAVDPTTGMANDVPVQLYGYREITTDADLEIDPLMTGWFGRPFAQSSVISFGRNKILDIGAGGAFLTNDLDLSEKMSERGYFPSGLIRTTAVALSQIPEIVNKRFEKIALWDRHLGDSCIRISREQIMPWRVMRRIPDKRDAVVRALRKAGFGVGTNYPPLPGVTDPGAISWGQEVINFFVTDDYSEHEIRAASEIIKRTIGQ